MTTHMTIEEARKVHRPKIIVGATYTFYSDCVECKTDNGNLLRAYSGQPVTVHALFAGDADKGTEATFKVRAANGDTFIANEGELNGWIFDTGQWVGPRVN